MRWRWCSFAMVLAGAAFGLTGSAARPTPAAIPGPIPVLAAATTPQADPWAGAADLFFKVAARDDEIPDAGLPRAVAQDGDGFIWLGTDGGLARWDGTGFKTYSTEPADGAGALPELMVNTLFTDRSGRLWLGMSAEGLLWRDPLTDSFHRPPNRTPLDRAHVIAIVDDDAGGLWVGSEAGLSHIRGSDHHATLVTGLPPGRIGAVHRDRNGRLWVGDESRLFRRDATGGFVAVPVPGVVGVITALHADDQGRLWIATAGSGFHVIAADGSIRHLPVTVDGHNVPLGAMIDAGNGEIWTASECRSPRWPAGRGIEGAVVGIMHRDLFPVLATDDDIGLAAQEDQLLVIAVLDEDRHRFRRGGGHEVDGALHRVEIAYAVRSHDKTLTIRCRWRGLCRELPFAVGVHPGKGALRWRQDRGIHLDGVCMAVLQDAMMRINGRCVAMHDDRKEVKIDAADGRQLVGGRLHGYVRGSGRLGHTGIGWTRCPSGRIG